MCEDLRETKRNGSGSSSDSTNYAYVPPQPRRSMSSGNEKLSMGVHSISPQLSDAHRPHGGTGREHKPRIRYTRTNRIFVHDTYHVKVLGIGLLVGGLLRVVAVEAWVESWGACATAPYTARKMINK